MTTVALLIAARDLIADPARWTQRAPARDNLGCPVEPNDDAAVCWCAVGAIDLVAGSGDFCEAHGAIRSAIQRATGCPGDYSITVWNDADARQHAEVLDVFARAIAELTGATS